MFTVILSIVKALGLSVILISTVSSALVLNPSETVTPIEYDCLVSKSTFSGLATNKSPLSDIIPKVPSSFPLALHF